VVTKKEKTSKSEKPAKKLTEINLVELVIKGMQEKKAQEITIVDLRNVKSAVADYFIICSANTDTQVDAIHTSVEEEVWKASGQDVWMKEGLQNREWILLDYADVVVHIFRTDRREFYALEDLWGDADITVLDDETDMPIKKEKKAPKVKEKKEEKVSAKAKVAKAKPNVKVASVSKTKAAKKPVAAKAKKTTAKKAASKPSATKKKPSK
jgi:ribosome-associated protein